MNGLGSAKSALLIAPLALLLIAGCSGGGGDNASSTVGRDSAGSAGGAGQAQAAPAKPGGGSEASDAGGKNNTQVRLDPNSAAGRAVIYTATLRVRTKNVDNAAAQAKQWVAGAGGYVETESAEVGAGSSSITFKVPADRYPALLDQLANRLGTRRELRQQAQDVTGEVADVDSRVRSAQATLASFRKLLDKANTVGEVINVEQEIAQRQADLEALQARQKALAEQTRYATVTLTLDGPSKPAIAAPKPRKGFVGGLLNGWDAFTSVLGALAMALGWLLPFLLLTAVFGAPALYARRRHLARRAASQSTPSP